MSERPVKYMPIWHDNLVKFGKTFVTGSQAYSKNRKKKNIKKSTMTGESAQRGALSTFSKTAARFQASAPGVNLFHLQAH